MCILSAEECNLWNFVVVVVGIGNDDDEWQTSWPPNVCVLLACVEILPIVIASEIEQSCHSTGFFLCPLTDVPNVFCFSNRDSRQQWNPVSLLYAILGKLIGLSRCHVNSWEFPGVWNTLISTLSLRLVKFRASALLSCVDIILQVSILTDDTIMPPFCAICKLIGWDLLNLNLDRALWRHTNTLRVMDPEGPLPCSQNRNLMWASWIQPTSLHPISSRSVLKLSSHITEQVGVMVTLLTWFGRFWVRVLAGTPAMLTDFTWFLSVPPGKYWAGTSIRGHAVA
jgi:hypothetical protein